MLLLYDVLIILLFFVSFLIGNKVYNLLLDYPKIKMFNY